MGKAKAFLKTPLSATRGEHIAMAATTGVAVGTTNNVINRNYFEKSKAKYKARRLNGRHGMARKGGVN